MSYDFCDLPPLELRLYQPNAAHPEPPDDPDHILQAYIDARDGTLNIATPNLLGWTKIRPRLPLVLAVKYVMTAGAQEWSPSLHIDKKGTLRIRKGALLRIGR